MPDRPAVQQVPTQAAPAARPGSDLLPFDPAEGSGQRLSDAERIATNARVDLEAARLKADDVHRQSQMEIRSRQRELAEAELEKQRSAAMESVEEQGRQNEALFQRFPGSAQMVHPAWLEIEGARVRAMADALQQDETVPGGCYIVDGRKVDADGKPLE